MTTSIYILLEISTCFWMGSDFYYEISWEVNTIAFLGFATCVASVSDDKDFLMVIGDVHGFLNEIESVIVSSLNIMLNIFETKLTIFSEEI